MNDEQEGSGDERQPLFNHLLNSLRFARMSAAFLASILYEDWVKESGLGFPIMQRAIWRRDDERMLHPTKWPSSRVNETFTKHFTKTAVEALRDPKDSVWASLGLLHGFPYFLELAR